MSDEVRRGAFDPHDLEKVDDSRTVTLASGGPQMVVVATEGDNCLCEWAADDGTVQRHLFPYWTLRRMIFFRPGDVPFATDDPLGKRPGRA